MRLTRLSPATALRQMLAGIAWLPRRCAAPPDADADTHPELVACDGCDALYTRRPLTGNDVARCRRCAALLGRGHSLRIDGQFALAITSLVLFVIGNVSAIVTLELRGQHSRVTLYEAIRETWLAGQPAVALLAAATAFAFPLATILLELYVLAPLATGWRPRGFVPAMRLLRWTTRWSMVEVFMLGTLIAIVRSAGVGDVVPGVGIYSYAALTLLLTANQAAGLQGLWHRASECRNE